MKTAILTGGRFVIPHLLVTFYDRGAYGKRIFAGRMPAQPIYLDFNATTPVDPRVLEAMLPFFTQHFGNAASRTHAFGWAAEGAVNTARQQTAELINAEPQEIIFTSGATEAINLAIKGVFETYKSKGRHIVTVQTEHKAVLDTCAYLETQGASVTYLPVDPEGLIDLQQLEKAITPETILVSVMTANNETGVLQPIQDIARIVHDKKSIFMSDATQAAGKISIDVQQEGIDLLCLSAHKFYGPKGVGALYVRRKSPRVTLQPILHGGGHERGLRSGTLNTTGIVGLGKACEIAAAEYWDNAALTSRLRTWIEQYLMDAGDVQINGSTRHRLPNTTNLSLGGIKADRLIAKLPTLALATGSACTSANPEPSHVLRAMGLSDADAQGSIRISLGKTSTEDEMKTALALISTAVSELRSQT